MRPTQTIALVVAAIGVVLFIPVYLVSPAFNLETLSAFYLGGFIFVEVFIFAWERWREETSKPRLVVEPMTQLPYENVTQIRVRLPEHVATEDARFFFLQVKNIGEKTAEDVIPLLAVPPLWSSLTKLAIVPPTGDPWMSVEWKGTTDEFDRYPERYARAVIYDKNTLREPVSLYGGGLACGFALFFTVKDCPGVYFPSETSHAIRFPCKFQAVLYFQAKDLPLFPKVAAYEIEASDWNSIEVTEVTEEKKSRLRSLFHRKPKHK
jgi:hypothetical protein